MDKNWKGLAAKLPVQPSGALKTETLMDVYDSNALGYPLVLYHRESVELADEIQQTMGPEEWKRWERSRMRRWGARCTCSNCGEDFIAGYSKGGIVLTEGPDGQTYEGYAEPGLDASVYFNGDTITCPRCWTTAEVTHRSELRHGRTFQVLHAEVVNVDCYTAVMYWLVRRCQDDIGSDTTTFVP